MKTKTLDQEVRGMNDGLVSVEVGQATDITLISPKEPGKTWNYLPVNEIIATGVVYKRLDEFLSKHYCYDGGKEKFVSKEVNVVDLNELLSEFEPFEDFYLALTSFFNETKNFKTWLEKTTKYSVGNDTKDSLLILAAARSQVEMPLSVYNEGKNHIEGALRAINDAAVNCHDGQGARNKPVEEQTHYFEEHLKEFYKTKNLTQLIMLANTLVDKIEGIRTSLGDYYSMYCNQENYITGIRTLREFAKGKEKITFSYMANEICDFKEVLPLGPKSLWIRSLFYD